VKGKGDAFMKRANYLRAFLPWQSEFDHHFACWAGNHRGWSKMKKFNRRLAKRRERRHWRKEAMAYADDDGREAGLS
jgi:hypothetical protein